MSANARETVAVKAARDDHHASATARGHRLRWQLGANAHRRGHEYFWEGQCEHCGAAISVGATWSSCPGVRDARHAPCSGPGTSVLTDIETERAGELIAVAAREFLRAHARPR